MDSVPGAESGARRPCLVREPEALLILAGYGAPGRLSGGRAVTDCRPVSGEMRLTPTRRDCAASCQRSSHRQARVLHNFVRSGGVTLDRASSELLPIKLAS